MVGVSLSFKSIIYKMTFNQGAIDCFRQSERHHYTPRIPYNCTIFGQPYRKPYSVNTCHYTRNSRQRLSTEWTPQRLRPSMPLAVQPQTIYYTSIGLVPHYGGHIPGAMFRHGKTYGRDTIDAKRCLYLDE